MARRILLVDDEAALRSIAARALRSEGYEVIEVPDGLQAWTLAKESRFDLLITDSRMPHLSGTQLAALVRELRPTMPILRISGSPGSGSDRPIPQLAEHNAADCFRRVATSQGAQWDTTQRTLPLTAPGAPSCASSSRQQTGWRNADVHAVAVTRFEIEHELPG